MSEFWAFLAAYDRIYNVVGSNEITRKMDEQSVLFVLSLCEHFEDEGLKTHYGEKVHFWDNVQRQLHWAPLFFVGDDLYLRTLDLAQPKLNDDQRKARVEQTLTSVFSELGDAMLRRDGLQLGVDVASPFEFISIDPAVGSLGIHYFNRDEIKSHRSARLMSPNHRRRVAEELFQKLNRFEKGLFELIRLGTRIYPMLRTSKVNSMPGFDEDIGRVIEFYERNEIWNMVVNLWADEFLPRQIKKGSVLAGSGLEYQDKKQKVIEYGLVETAKELTMARLGFDISAYPGRDMAPLLWFILQEGTGELYGLRPLKRRKCYMTRLPDKRYKTCFSFKTYEI
jgi:hypothetical protein